MAHNLTCSRDHQPGTTR